MHQYQPEGGGKLRAVAVLFQHRQRFDAGGKLFQGELPEGDPGRQQMNIRSHHP